VGGGGATLTRAATPVSSVSDGGLALLIRAPVERHQLLSVARRRPLGETRPNYRHLLGGRSSPVVGSSKALRIRVASRPIVCCIRADSSQLSTKRTVTTRTLNKQARRPNKGGSPFAARKNPLIHLADGRTGRRRDGRASRGGGRRSSLAGILRDDPTAEPRRGPLVDRLTDPTGRRPPWGAARKPKQLLFKFAPTAAT
jgi:hypothetical protein